jgi:hypothetical protein
LLRSERKTNGPLVETLLDLMSGCLESKSQ